MNKCFSPFSMNKKPRDLLCLLTLRVFNCHSLFGYNLGHLNGLYMEMIA